LKQETLLAATKKVLLLLDLQHRPALLCSDDKMSYLLQSGRSRRADRPRRAGQRPALLILLATSLAFLELLRRCRHHAVNHCIRPRPRLVLIPRPACSTLPVDQCTHAGTTDIYPTTRERLAQERQAWPPQCVLRRDGQIVMEEISGNLPEALRPSRTQFLTSWPCILGRAFLIRLGRRRRISFASVRIHGSVQGRRGSAAEPPESNTERGKEEHCADAAAVYVHQRLTQAPEVGLPVE
jgi:hypothetical protein